MGLKILLRVFLGQAVVIAIIVIVLKKILDRKLIEFCVRSFELWKDERGMAASITLVTVIAHRRLHPMFLQRVVKAAMGHFGDNVKIAQQVDRRLLGGLMIVFGKQTIDFSLRDRLRMAWG